MEALERKIEKAQEQVSKTKKQYDAAIQSLSDLLDKRDVFRRDELLRTMINSDRTYEEMFAFLESGKTKEEIKNGNKADGRRGRKIKRDNRR